MCCWPLTPFYRQGHGRVELYFYPPSEQQPACNGVTLPFSSHCCEGSQCLYPQGQAICFLYFDCFTLKVMAPCALLNFGKYHSSDTVSHLRRHESSAIPLWELQTHCARKYIIPIHISSQTQILLKSDFILFEDQTISWSYRPECQIVCHIHGCVYTLKYIIAQFTLWFYVDSLLPASPPIWSQISLHVSINKFASD